jgi:predicted SAM-dependent methyltransferase
MFRCINVTGLVAEVGMGDGASAELAGVWDWQNPGELMGTLDGFMAGFARCERLERVGTLPLGRAELVALGLTGIEFAAFKTRHPAGLGTDIIGLTSDDEATRPGELYRVDGQYYFAELDICAPLPLESGCVDWVYAEHLIEHVSLTEGIAWLAEVRRILRPGGLLRLSTPDLRRYARAYVEGGDFMVRHRRRMRAAMPIAPPMPERGAFMFNQMFYLYGHRWIYDAEELEYALTGAGFAAADIRRCGYRDGARADVSDLDQKVRDDESIYVEATVSG